MTELVRYPALKTSSSEPTRLLLVRHGQTAGNIERLLHGRTDSHLSETGVTQAERVALRIKSEFDIDTVISSPLSRALDTAAIISDQFGLQRSIVDDLTEMNFGDVEGFTFERLLAEFPELAKKAMDPFDRSLEWPNGESRAAFHERSWRVFNEIVADHAGNAVVVVSHNGVLGSFLAQVRGDSPDNWQAFRIANCSLSSLELTPEGTVIHLLNDITHLGDLVTMITAESVQPK